jgi:threonine dehydrogenase-like Zn-dependent dehydrogenase
MCAIGAASSCWNLASKAFTGGFGHGFTVGLGGGWGDQLVAHASQLHAAPAGVDARTAALTEPLSVSVHALGRRLPVDGAPALVVGAGIIGLTTVVALRHVAPTSPITVLARHPHQAAAAVALGAHHVVRPDDGGAFWDELAALSGATRRGRRDGATLSGGYPYVVEAVGSPASVGMAMRAAGQRGVVVVIGGIQMASGVDLSSLWFRELDVVGAFCHAVDRGPDGARHSFDVALDLLAAGMLPPSLVVTHEYPLAELRAACEAARDKATGAIKVLLRP